MDETNQAALENQPAEEQPERTFTRDEVDQMLERHALRLRREAEARVRAAREEGYSEGERLSLISRQEREEAERAAREREEVLSARERELDRRELKSAALETLREKRLPGSLAAILDYSGAEACAASIDLVEQVMREAIQEGVNRRIATVADPLRRGISGADAMLAELRRAAGLDGGR